MFAALVLATDTFADANAVSSAMSKTADKAPLRLTISSGLYPVGLGAVALHVTYEDEGVLEQFLTGVQVLAAKDKRVLGWAQFTDAGSFDEEHGTLLVDSVPDAVSDAAFGARFAERNQVAAVTELRDDVVVAV